jgi:glycosyltransferase involved in cell wall biosynthesis
VAQLSVVIPACNEERSIFRVLDAIGDLADEADAVVVCNGCTDRTAVVVAEVAPWVQLVELDEGSKPAALRAGDAAVRTMPRLYLDADVVVSAESVRRLAVALDADHLVAVSPTPRYDFGGASRIVRSHYRIWTALYTNVDAVYGTGAIMLSASGRARFGEWPDVIADDYYVDGLFDPVEKRRLPDVEVVVALPRSFGACVSRKARVHQGKRDVVRAGLGPDGPPLPGRSRSLAGLVRARPALALHVPAHLLVTVTARLVSAWRRWRGTAMMFYRDTSTRSR